MTGELFPGSSPSCRSIPFSTSSIHGIQKRLKTHTRRVMYPQPVGERLVQDAQRSLKWLGEGEQIWRCPYGVSGDLLRIKEIWALVEPYPRDNEKYYLPVAWRIEKNPILLEYWRKRVIFYADFPGKMPEDCGRGASDNKWRSATTMPQWATRLLIKVNDARPERVQEISEEDALAEGIQRQALPDLDGNRYHWGDISKNRYKTAVAAYAALWDSINGWKNPWAANPWVWRVAFEMVDGPNCMGGK